jgi:hypothetical protein
MLGDASSIVIRGIYEDLIYRVSENILRGDVLQTVSPFPGYRNFFRKAYKLKEKCGTKSAEISDSSNFCAIYTITNIKNLVIINIFFILTATIW